MFIAVDSQFESPIHMKLKRRWNERTRVMLTLELAVVLPAAALVILSVAHLRGIQRDRGVEAAFQRDFNHVLAISEKQFNQKAYDLVDDVREDFPSAGDACAAWCSVRNPRARMTRCFVVRTSTFPACSTPGCRWSTRIW
jgi:hypothetical protein